MRVHTALSAPQLYGAVIKILLAFYAGSSSTNGLSIDRRVSEVYEVLEGLPYTLSCSCSVAENLRNYTHLRASWYYQNRDVEETPRRYIHSGEPNTFSTHLKFLYVDRSLDGGEYTCEFQNNTFGAEDGETVNRRMVLKVIYVDVPQVVVVNRTETSVTLQCNLTAWNAEMVNLQWLHNFHDVPGPSNVGKTRTYLIDTSSVGNYGAYHCQVTPSLKIPESSPGYRGASMISTSLLSSNWFVLATNPNRSDSAYHIDTTDYNPHIFVNPNTSFEIRCPIIKRNSQSNVAWHRRKAERSDSSCISIQSSIDPRNGTLYSDITQNNDGTSVLRVHEFVPDECYNVMNFWCTFDAAEEELSFGFSVGLAQSQEPKILHLVATPSSYYAPDIPLSPRPKFCVMAIVNYMIVDTTYEWTCRTNTGMTMQFDLSDVYEIQKLPSGNVNLCMRHKDFIPGLYTIRMQNIYGSTTGQIEVKRWSKPEFRQYKAEGVYMHTSRTKNQEVYSLKAPEGSSLSLHCNISEPYLAIYWKRTWVDGASIKRGSVNYNSSIFTVYERTGVLQIKNATLDLAGNYTCSPALLFSQETFPAPAIAMTVTRALKVLSASAAIVGGTLVVECVVESEQWDGWYVNLTTEAGKPLQDVTQESGDSYTRVFKTQITRGKFPSKQFRCDAKSNNQLVSKTFAIETRPTMLMRPENITSLVGDTVLLHCLPESDEDWRVHWRPANLRNYVDDCNERNPSVEQLPCVMQNGTLRFASVDLIHAGWWTCLVALKGISGLSFDYDYNETSLLVVNERMVDVNNITRTVTIVIVSAVMYLALVVGITLWCSVRLMRKRKRRTTADDTQMTLLGSENGRVSKGNGTVNGGTRVLSVATVRSNGVANGQPASPASPAFASQTGQSQPNGSLHSSNLPAPAYNTGVHVSPAGSLPQVSSKHSGTSPGALPPPPPPSNNVYSPAARIPAYAWPIQDIRSTLTRISCSTCDGLSAGGIPVLCALHSAAMPSGIVSEYPQSVLSHQTNITSVSQQYQRDRAVMLHHPATTTPNSQSNCSSEAVRHIPRSQVQFLGRIGLGRFGEVTFGQLLFAHPAGPDQAVLPVRVAIKALSKTDEEARRDFHKEIDIFHGVQHAFVTELLGVCLEEEPLLLLFEYPEWGTLKHFLLAVRADHERLLQALAEGLPIDEQSPLPPLSLEQRVMMCLHVTAGMDYLAQHGRVHGELACRNLLLASNLSLKVGLLGVQDVFAGEYYHVPHGKNGTRKSKPISLRWMAPECVAHEIRLAHEHESVASVSSSTSTRSDAVYTSACDVWSFAMTAFEIFTYGELPFPTLTDVQVVDALLNAGNDKNAARLTDLATHCVPRFANAIVPPAKVGGVLPDPRFNDFTRCPQSLRHVLEQCWRIEVRHRPSFAEISVAFGEQLGDCKM